MGLNVKNKEKSLCWANVQLAVTVDVLCAFNLEPAVGYICVLG